MKARILPGQRLSQQEKENVRRYVAEQVKEERKQQSQIFTNRILKIIFVTLSLEFGFGKQRLQRFRQRLDELLVEAASDELYWWHIDQIITGELGLDFPRESLENYECFEKNHREIAKGISQAMRTKAQNAAVTTPRKQTG